MPDDPLPPSEKTLISKRMGELGLSYKDLAIRIEKASNGLARLDPLLVLRWSKRMTPPGPGYVLALAEALALDPQDLRDDISNWRQTRGGGLVIFPDPPSGKPGTAPETLEEVLAAMKRRGFLKASVGVALLAAGPFGEADVPIAPEALELAEARDAAGTNRGLLNILAAVTEHYARNFDKYDYRQMKSQLAVQLRAAASLLRRPLRYDERRDACLRASQLSSMLGLASHFVGEIAAASIHYGNAQELGHEIGHAQSSSFAAAEWASMACYSGQYGLAVELTNAASKSTRSTNIPALASNAARAYSRLGDVKNARKAIDVVENGMTEILPDQDCDRDGAPIWNFSRSSALTRIATSYLWIGDSSSAIEAAKEAVHLTGMRGIPRHGTHARLALAGGLAQLKEPEEACAIATATFEAAPKDMYTVLRRSADLLHFLEPYWHEQFVQDLVELIRNYPRQIGSVSQSPPNGRFS